jgi:hypothetical protein
MLDISNSLYFTSTPFQFLYIKAKWYYDVTQKYLPKIIYAKNILRLFTAIRV